jgi:hypothetical protein
MAYFNHAFQKAFPATLATQATAGVVGDPGGVAGVTDGILTEVGVHVSNLKSVHPTEGYLLGPGVTGFFDAKTDLSIDLAANTTCCNFYVGAAAIKINDKQGPFHGGYQQAHKSKEINPKYLRKAWGVEGNLPSRAVVQIGGTPDNIAGDATCDKEFLCGEDYNLRIEVKGTPALRFANHNLYQTLQANGGCCATPGVPAPVNPSMIYLQWARQIVDDPYLKDFIRPIIIADGDSYAYDAAAITEEGLNAGNTFDLLETLTPTVVGMVLLGAYADTQFSDCTFQTMDYYQKEPIQIYASEVDLNGDPCAFEGLCVVTTCNGIQANGLGETVVREMILSESYLQNFTANDLRIREITQGTEAYNVFQRTAIYSKFYMLHTVPRFNNPSGTFDNDQYLLCIIGNDAMVAALKADVDTMNAACGNACEVADIHVTAPCPFTLPVV